MLKKFIGTKEFYKTTLAVILPIIIQNTITTFVNFLDNIMVGQIGTEQMSGVAIVNQFFFVFNLCIFGSVAGAGIFVAQFFGNKNNGGIKHCFRIKLLAVLLVDIISILLLILFQDTLIDYFLHDGSIEGDLDLTFNCAKDYLSIIIFTTIPFSINYAYTSTLRETGETILPMKAGFVAVIINCVFNYLLIFGKFGFPNLGIKGAAIATLLARIVECLLVIISTHANKEKNPWIKGIAKTFRIDKGLLKSVIVKGIPLFINETLWALAMTLLLQCYSVRGLSAVAATNISNTLDNLFSIVFMSIGSSISIIVGQLLGAEKLEEAKVANNRIIGLSVMSTIVMGSLLACFSGLIPQLYNTNSEVKEIAKNNLLVIACFMPIHSIMHASYFTLRTGGKTFLTFLFDSGFAMFISVPLAFVLSRYTTLSVTAMFAIVNSINIIKAVWGSLLLKKGIWLNVLINKDQEVLKKH